MKPRLAYLLSGCVLATCLPGLPAAADILIESHQDQRPADAEAVLGAFRAELEASGVKVRAADVIAAGGAQLPLPGVSDPTLDRGYTHELSEQVALGTTQVLRGDYAGGLATLEGVLARARENPGLVVADASSPGWLTKAYAALAFAQIRSQRRDAAIETVAEQIRSFPEDPIGRIVGPEVATLADDVRKKLDASPHGDLQIVVSQPDVQIFLDERLRAAGRMRRTAVPGVYRVLLVRLGVSRRYTVRVLPGKRTDLNIDWDADTAFTITGDWTGFAGTRGHDDRTQAAATRYARASRQHDVLVASLIEQSGRWFLAGEIFEKTTGVRLRHKTIALGPDDDTCKRALAQHLLSGKDSTCWVDLTAETLLQVMRLAERPKENDPFVGPGIVGGLGAMAVIGGATLLMTKQDSPTGTPSYVSAPGISLLAGGGLAIGAAIFWAARKSGEAGSRRVPRERSSAPLFVAAGTAAAALVAGGYLFHLDGGGTCGGDGSLGECPYRYAITRPALMFIGTGVAAAGFGFYWSLYAQGTGKTTVVGVNPTSTGALASVRGSF